MASNQLRHSRLLNGSLSTQSYPFRPHLKLPENIAKSCLKLEAWSCARERCRSFSCSAHQLQDESQSLSFPYMVHNSSSQKFLHLPNYPAPCHHCHLVFEFGGRCRLGLSSGPGPGFSISWYTFCFTVSTSYGPHFSARTPVPKASAQINLKIFCSNTKSIFRLEAFRSVEASLFQPWITLTGLVSPKPCCGVSSIDGLGQWSCRLSPKLPTSMTTYTTSGGISTTNCTVPQCLTVLEYDIQCWSIWGWNSAKSSYALWQRVPRCELLVSHSCTIKSEASMLSTLKVKP